MLHNKGDADAGEKRCRTSDYAALGAGDIHLPWFWRCRRPKRILSRHPAIRPGTRIEQLLHPVRHFLPAVVPMPGHQALRYCMVFNQKSGKPDRNDIFKIRRGEERERERREREEDGQRNQDLSQAKDHLLPVWASDVTSAAAAALSTEVLQATISTERILPIYESLLRMIKLPDTKHLKMASGFINAPDLSRNSDGAVVLEGETDTENYFQSDGANNPNRQDLAVHFGFLCCAGGLLMLRSRKHLLGPGIFRRLLPSIAPLRISWLSVAVQKSVKTINEARECKLPSRVQTTIPSDHDDDWGYRLVMPILAVGIGHRSPWALLPTPQRPLSGKFLIKARRNIFTRGFSPSRSDVLLLLRNEKASSAVNQHVTFVDNFLTFAAHSTKHL